MQTTPKANNILGHFFALLGAVVMLAIATWVSASSSEQVEPLDNLVTARTGHTATALSDGRILITGGRDADGNLVAASEIFDPETQTSSTSGTLHTARVDHSATVLADGRVLVAGGTGASGALSSAEMFDPAHPENGFQTLGSSMSTARTRHTATLLNDGHVLIAGGDAQGSAELFDPATGTFMPTIWPLTVARSGHTATLFTDDSVLLAGGNTATLETYVPNQGFTLDAATMSVVRTGHWAFELSDSRLLLFQGDTGNTIDEFNPSSGTITPKGSLNFHASSSSLLANGKLLVVGTDVVGLYNPDATPPAPDFTAFDEASVPNSGVLPRGGQSSTELPGDKKVLIAGGANTQNIFQGMALFNPARIWTDRDDYVPNDPVVLSGSGWKANEDVYLYAVDDINQGWTYGATETAGADGSFVDSPFFIVQQQQLGAHFTVTAVGAQSNMQADVEFTDAGNLTYSPASQSLTIAAGASSGFSQSVTDPKNNDDLTVAPVVTGTGGNQLPASWVSTSPASLSFPASSNDQTQSWTVTISVPSAAAAGTYTGTIGGHATAVPPGTKTPNDGSQPTNVTIIVPAAVATTTTVASSLNPSVYGTSVTFTATVARTSGSGTPTGNVNFTIAGIGVVAGTPGATTANTATWTATTSSLTAGNHSVSASYVHTGLFQDSSGSLASGQTVNLASLTITANNQNKTYGTAFTFTGTEFTTGAGQLKNGDTVTSATFTSSGAAATATVSGSPYSIVPSAAVFSPAGAASNYNIAYTNGSFTVNAAPLTITANNQTKSYGTAFTFTGTDFSVGAGQLKNGDAVASVTLTSAGAAATATVAGSPYTITPSAAVFSPAGAATNYIISYSNGSFTVTGATLDITANNQSKTYGSLFTFTGSEFSVGAGQLKNGDTVSSVTLTSAGSAATANVVGSPYTITPSAAVLSPAGAAANYIVTYHNGSFTINTAPLDITATNESKSYGDTFTPNGATQFSTAPSQLKNGDVVASVTLSSSGYAPTATVTGSPYDITANSAVFTPAVASSNYAITYHVGHLTVNAAPLDITATNESKSYGDTFTPNGATQFSTAPSQLKNGDVVASVTLTSTGYAPGAGVAGSPYTITASAAMFTPMTADSNYAITYHVGHLTVNAAPLDITATNESKSYGDTFTPNGGTQFSTAPSQLKNGDVVASVTLTSTGYAPGADVAGSPYTITASAAVFTPMAANTNYAITYHNGELTITKATLTVTAQDASRGYGDANPTFTASYSGFKNGETLGTSGVTGSPSLTTTATATSAASPPTYLITAAIGTLAAGNYDFTFANGHLTIEKATLTVTAQDASRGYGDANPTFTASYSGFKNGETLASSGVTGSPSLTTSATATSPASPPTYLITAAIGTLAAGNYDFTFANGHLTIEKATLTVTAQDASRGYGDANPTFTASYSGFKNGETLASSGVTGSPSLTTSATATSPASPPTYLITAAIGTLAAGNYDFTFANGHLTIEKATLTVTADDANREYGDANPTFTASYSGFKNGETLASSGVTGTPSLTTTATATSAVPGPYAITAAIGTLVAGNYDFTFANGELTITKATLTVTADDTSRGYGDPNPTFTANYSGFKNGEALASSGVTGSPSLTTTATATSAVPGPYAITAAIGTLAAGNYDFTFANGELTITKATLTVTAANASRGYGDANPTFTGSYSGFKNGETLGTSGVTGSPSLTTTATATSAVPGPYAITAALGTLAAGNYDFTFVNGQLTITKATLTVTTDDTSRGYGDANPTFTATYSGFKNGETLASSGVTGSPSLTTTATAMSAVPGPYAITAALGTLAAGNYTFTFVNGALTITKATLTVTAEDKSRTYGASNPTFTASYSGFKNGETLASSGVTGSPSLTTIATAMSAASPPTYAITAALGTLAAGNYTFTFANGQLTITKTTLTVTADSVVGTPAVDPFTKVYNGLVYTGFTARYDGFVNGEMPNVLSGTLSFSGAGTTAVLPGGPYTVTPGGLTSSNYNIAFVNGTLNIGFGNCAGGGVIQQPINADGSSVFPKAGRTVPVKFYVCDASGNHISDPNVVFAGTGGQLTMLSQVRSQIQTVDEGTYNDVPDAAFRWSPGDNIWIWNMTTNNLQSGNKYTFHINLRNGTYIEFFIAIK